MSKTRQVLAKIDVAVLVVDGSVGLSAADRELTELFKEKNINYIIAYNKSDLVKDDIQVQNSAAEGIDRKAHGDRHHDQETGRRSDTAG